MEDIETEIARLNQQIADSQIKINKVADEITVVQGRLDSNSVNEDERQCLRDQKDKLRDEKDKLFVEKDKLLVEKDKLLVEKDKLLVEKDKLVVELLVEKDKLVVELLVEKDKLLTIGSSQGKVSGFRSLILIFLQTTLFSSF